MPTLGTSVAYRTRAVDTTGGEGYTAAAMPKTGSMASTGHQDERGRTCQRAQTGKRAGLIVRGARTMFPTLYPRMVEILQLWGAGGHMMTPSERNLGSLRRADIERYFQGVQAPASERIQLFRLAWDIVGSAFGSRQLLYERYFSGDPIRVTAGRHLTYIKAPLLERVGDFLQHVD
jgi:aromatic ring hydroxylase